MNKTMNEQLDAAIDQVIDLKAENAELVHDNIILRDSIADMQLTTLNCLDGLSTVANLYEPHHIAIKMETPKEFQPIRKGILDAIAIVQHDLANIGYEFTE